jgi:hypothetical protein
VGSLQLPWSDLQRIAAGSYDLEQAPAAAGKKVFKSAWLAIAASGIPLLGAIAVK